MAPRVREESRILSFQREQLLYIWSLSSAKSHQTLFSIRVRHSLNRDCLHEIDVVSSNHEREYLQSLVHFRAFKSTALDCASWEQWNEEAQKILEGALIFGCNEITVEVYDAMMSAGVLPDHDTFTLLSRVSLAKNDFMVAKSFLTQMSNAGFIPPRDLVDRVSRHFKAISKGLNRDAPVFVPNGAPRIGMRE